METTAPDLVPHFDSSAPTDADKTRCDDDATIADAELEQLAERVSAARSVY